MSPNESIGKMQGQEFHLAKGLAGYGRLVIKSLREAAVRGWFSQLTSGKSRAEAVSLCRKGGLLWKVSP